jgi:hypothetical protein
MGLLNFTKKARKQGQAKKPRPDSQHLELTQHVPSKDDDNTVSFPLPNTTRKLNLEDSVPKEPETSLMDDIMSELGSAKSITSDIFHESPLTRQTKGKLIKLVNCHLTIGLCMLLWNISH